MTVNAALKAKAVGPETKAKAKAIKGWPRGASRPRPALEDHHFNDARLLLQGNGC